MLHHLLELRSDAGVRRTVLLRVEDSCTAGTARVMAGQGRRRGRWEEGCVSLPDRCRWDRSAASRRGECTAVAQHRKMETRPWRRARGTGDRRGQ